jgi:hypothetical protein
MVAESGRIVTITIVFCMTVILSYMPLTRAKFYEQRSDH